EILFPDREMMTIPELAEMDFGDFEGKNVDELIELPEYKAWLKGGLDNSPPNGESLRKITERTYQALQNILINMSNENLSHCGIVTHSGIIMNMLACFGLPKMKPLEFASEVGEGYEIVISLQLWQSGGVFEIIGKLPYTADFDDGYDF
ncbi:MAG: histidine phosphatase family protein, partial [Oscillospiraceae bacterium]